jgi:hypothetical protein
MMRIMRHSLTAPPILTDGVRLSHHDTYSSRIQGFIKIWGNYLVIRIGMVKELG